MHRIVNLTWTNTAAWSEPLFSMYQYSVSFAFGSLHLVAYYKLKETVIGCIIKNSKVSEGMTSGWIDVLHFNLCMYFQLFIYLPR